MSRLTTDQIHEIWENAKKHVRVACDSYHGHSAIDNCLVGKESHSEEDPYVLVCKLCENNIQERNQLKNIVTHFDDKYGS